MGFASYFFRGEFKGLTRSQEIGNMVMVLTPTRVAAALR